MGFRGARRGHPAGPTRSIGLVVVVALAGLVAGLLAGCGIFTGSTDASTNAVTGLAQVALADLPAEAERTVALIESGGPFPHDRDGITFHNREGLLPPQPDGYYREYTVVTPGSTDRGPRRIVAGEQGELYYTDDHYASFREVTQ